MALCAIWGLVFKKEQNIFRKLIRAIKNLFRKEKLKSKSASGQLKGPAITAAFEQDKVARRKTYGHVVNELKNIQQKQKRKGLKIPRKRRYTI